MKKIRMADVWMIVTFLAITIILIVLFFTTEKELFSEDENRMLAKAPAVSGKTIWNGSAYEALEKYLTDHIPFRKSLLALHAANELSMGKRESNGVIYDKNYGAIKRAEYHNIDATESALNKVTEIINIAHSKNMEAHALFVPNKIDLYGNEIGIYTGETSSEYLRNYINKNLQDQIDIYEELCVKIEQGQQIWFQSDHHWTSFGAYVGYATFLREIGMAPYPLSQFYEQTVSQSFYGTQYSASGFFWLRGDALSLLRWQGDENIVVKNTEWMMGDRELYHWEALQSKDKYAVFLGGNYERLSVSDPTRESLPKLLLIKDSFANAVVPLLARHFQLEIYDPRYRKASLADAVASSDASYMLILCSFDTLLSI